MGVEFEVYLVDDWEKFTSKITETNDTYISVELLNPESTACSGYLSAQYDFMECLDAIKGKWAGEASKACKTLFDHLFWSHREIVRHRIVEIGITQRPFGLDVAWEPGTTKRFGELARRVDLEECWRVFSPGNQDRFKTHEEFAEYGSFWLDVVLRGADSCRGLAVVVLG